MEEIFDVTHGGQTVGAVVLHREGLYCRVFCCCRVDDGEIHRLYANDEKIGVLIPENGELVLETKVAAKRLKPGCSFSLDKAGDGFAPIRPGEAFSPLDKLRLGKLVFQDGQMGIMVKT